VELYLHSPRTPSWHGNSIGAALPFTFTITLKGQRFQDIEDIQNKVTIALKAVPQQEF
jgi:hypothetical protein